MKVWSTTIYAIDPVSRDQREFCGPNIMAPIKELAFEYCQNNYLGYCYVGDQIIMEIPCDKDNRPDFKNMIDYEIIYNN